MSISKEEITAKVSHKEILDHFLKPYYYGKPMKQGIMISNPLLSEKQKTPSFNLYKKGDKWRFKDFSGMEGSAFDLVMQMYNVNFSECLDIINREMFLGLDSDNGVKTAPKRLIPKPEPVEEFERNYNYDLDIIPWTKDLLKFWNLYGITQETLEVFNVKPLRGLFAYNKSNKPYYIAAKEFEPIYAYIHEGWAKIYMPYTSFMRFLNVGEKPDEYVFGLDQLPQKGKNFYLTGGEKDVITMYQHGMSAVCLNSEESNPVNYPKLLHLFKSGRFENHWIIYDGDKTGLKQMEKIVTEFPILKIKKVPEMVNGNDISDYYKNYYANRAIKK